MKLWMLFAVVGANLVQFFPGLPAIAYIHLAGLLALACALCICFYSRKAWWISALIAGIYWASITASYTLSEKLPLAVEGETVKVEGWVVSLPERRERGWKFRFRVLDKEKKEMSKKVRGDLLINWYGNEEIKPGERWQFLVKLIRPHGSFNLGQFDYEGWLFQQGISAKGYALPGLGERLGRSWFIAPHHQLRYWLREKLLKNLQESPVKGVIVALAIGESAQLSSSQWRTLSATGTNHLLIISGLHVGMVFVGALFLLLKAGLGLRNAIFCAMFFSTAYGAVAGFGLPVQRALFMSAASMLGLVLCRYIPVFDLLVYSLFFVVMIEPFAALSAGFWLSFGAVFLLLYAFSSRTNLEEALVPLSGAEDCREDGLFSVELVFVQIFVYLKRLLLSQWVIMMGLFPVLITTVSQFAMLSMVANLIALPAIGLVVVPLLLTACLALVLFEPLGAEMLFLTQMLVTPIWNFLELIANYDWVFYPTAFPQWAMILSVVGALICLLPRGFVNRWIGVLLLLPIVFPETQDPEAGSAQIMILDVGQGLAILVRTRNHRLLYDTGPRFGSGFDAGERIVLPEIRRTGRNGPDVMILSHGDMDHVGGSDILMDRLDIPEIWSSKPLAGNLSRDCIDAHKWSWDGVVFEIYRLDKQLKGNNESCILAISAGAHRVLIPGDIEKDAESALMRMAQKGFLQLKSDVLVAPHHGSMTSSTPGFLNAVDPAWVIISAGYQNRFGHPHQQVLQRYHARGIEFLNTSKSGAIEITIGVKPNIEFGKARDEKHRVWHEKTSDY